MITHESCTFRDQPGAVRPEDVTLPSHLPDEPGIRQNLARHYNAIARMDTELGQHLNDLETDGLAEHTIVFYFSDHGSALPRSKRYLYDDGLRVPLIVRVPPMWWHLSQHGPRSLVKSPASLVDLFPSFLAIAGLPIPPQLHDFPLLGKSANDRRYVFGGRDRMGERYDLSRTVRSSRYRYVRNYAPHRPLGQYVAFELLGAHYQDYETARVEGRLDAKREQFWRQKPGEEFQDLDADSDATANLTESRSHQVALDEHRMALDAHLLAIGDTGFIPKHSALENWHASQDAAQYPLQAVMDLAGRAASRDPGNVPNFLMALSHPSPIVRHWAAKGLLILAAADHPLPEGLEQIHEQEDDPQV